MNYTNFKAFLESHETDDTGFTAYGKIISVSLRRDTYTDLMQFDVKGTRTLGKLKSLDSIKDDYNEEDWATLEKLWIKVAEKHAKDVDKLVNKFENDLNKVIIAMEKDLIKY